MPYRAPGHGSRSWTRNTRSTSNLRRRRPRPPHGRYAIELIDRRNSRTLVEEIDEDVIRRFAPERRTIGSGGP